MPRNKDFPFSGSLMTQSPGEEKGARHRCHCVADDNLQRLSSPKRLRAFIALKNSHHRGEMGWGSRSAAVQSHLQQAGQPRGQPRPRGPRLSGAAPAAIPGGCRAGGRTATLRRTGCSGPSLGTTGNSTAKASRGLVLLAVAGEQLCKNKTSFEVLVPTCVFSLARETARLFCL